MSEQCGECGAPTAERTCAELFDQLLALDHQRAQPWGAYHGISVACHVLQHPLTVGPHQRGAQLDIVDVFCRSGLDGLRRLTSAARTRNSHPGASSGTGPRTEPPRPRSDFPSAFGVTIHDVSVDGTFPAEGFEQRVEQWAHAVRAAWTSPGS